jgi:hypothetical protein
MFEANGELGIGIIVNGGAMVRLSGNCLEGLAGPGIIANQVDALTVVRHATLFQISRLQL